jgi:pimeloyl-ACP methyl ester carboxylesterase
VGFFGISKGAGAGILAASRDAYVLCFVTDGMFATRTTLLPYMKQWFRIYNNRFPQVLIPKWYYRWIGHIALRTVERERRCHFPALEEAMAGIAPRPLLMIHGGQDTYIKPDMARALFEQAGQPCDFWLVENAKHNQAMHVAGAEYHQRVLLFFERHLASGSEVPFSEPGEEDSAVRMREPRQEARHREPALGR